MFVLGVIIPNSEEYLALVPAYTIPPHFFVWNILTSGFYEISLFSAIFDVIALLLFGKKLEPMWGSKEYMQFILLVNAVAGFSTFCFMVVAYSLLGLESLWFAPFSGFSGVIGGFMVALKQIAPEQELNLLPGVSLRAKHLPGLLLLVNFTFFFLGFPSTSLPFTFFGVCGAWVYLRFYQRHEGHVGDRSEEFSFASFFPEPLKPAAKVVGNVTLSLFRLCRFCRDEQTLPQTRGSDPSDMFDSEAAERRRMRALRALDHRMQQVKAAANSQLPTAEPHVADNLQNV